MRLTFVNPVGGLGGAERVLLTAIRATVRAGHAAHLIACTQGPLLDHARALGATAAVLPMPPAMAATGDAGALATLARTLTLVPAAWGYTKQLKTAVDASRPDLVHSNGLKTHMLLWAAKPRAPIVWHLHDFVGQRKTASKALKWTSGRTRRAIAISQAVATDAQPVLPRTPIDVVMNAIDTDRFTPGESDPNALDRLAGLPPLGTDVIRVGLIATYARWKGQDLFLRAAAKAAHRNPALALRFFIIGGPIYHTAGSQWSEGELKALAEQLGIARRVGFVPFQPDPLAAYRGLDVVVHASTKPEPFGLTIVEAMACGKPVIVSAAGGALEIVQDNVSALTFPPNDESALADRIGRLASDADLRAKIGAAARDRAVSAFGEERFAAQLLASYARAIGN
ncbi:MAG TPA: glycosyltransferase family 4 protein [Tepidisphaeraceae bacterium]|nr:glycosyltransferase family 4 protein [Tepidisphaeraceae bacterium]